MLRAVPPVYGVVVTARRKGMGDRESGGPHQEQSGNRSRERPTRHVRHDRRLFPYEPMNPSVEQCVALETDHDARSALEYTPPNLGTLPGKTPRCQLQNCRGQHQRLSAHGGIVRGDLCIVRRISRQSSQRG